MTAPVDLVLAVINGYYLDDELRDALRDRAAQDTIRRVHLRGIRSAILLNSIISSIATEGEETQSKNVESFIVESNDIPPVDLTAFLSRYHLQKLQRLRLLGCRISSWDVLGLQTMALTTLELILSIESSPIPTLSQTLSIFSSNPLLQRIVLSYNSTLPVGGGDTPSLQVPLPHLKELHLTSDFWHAFGLLNRLELPAEMDSLHLDLHGCSHADISRTLGPYLGNFIRRRRRFPDGGLGLLSFPTLYHLDFNAGDTHRDDDSADGVWFVEVSAVLAEELEEGEGADRLYLDLVAHVPRERVIKLQTTLPILRSEELCIEMCDLARLCLADVDLSTWFVEPDIREPHTFKDVLRGLDHIEIREPILSDGDWGPLTDFLSRRAAVGNPISSLRLISHPHMDEDVVESIKCVVKDVYLDDQRT